MAHKKRKLNESKVLKISFMIRYTKFTAQELHYNRPYAKLSID